MNDYSNSILGAAASLLAASVTTEFLYSISNLTELWIGIILVGAVYLECIQKFLVNVVFSEKERERSERQVITLQFVNLLRVIFIIVLMRLVVDLFQYAVSVTPMGWDDYLNQFSFGIFYLLVAFHQFQENFTIKSRPPKSRSTRRQNSI